MKNKKPITWEQYQPLVYKLAYRYWKRLPEVDRRLYEPADLVNQCAIKWEYIVRKYNKKYAFSTLLFTACLRILQTYVAKRHAEHANLPMQQDHYTINGDEGDRLNILENTPDPRSSPEHQCTGHALVNADVRFAKMYQLSSRPLKEFLRLYILEGNYARCHPSLKTDETEGMDSIELVVRPIRDEFLRLARRHELDEREILMFFGAANAVGGRRKKSHQLVKV